jgi:hypothetical protein
MLFGPSRAVQYLCDKAGLPVAPYQVQEESDMGYKLAMDTSEWRNEDVSITSATLVYRMGV